MIELYQTIRQMLQIASARQPVAFRSKIGGGSSHRLHDGVGSPAALSSRHGWDDAVAAGKSAEELLLYRSNLLGSDLTITNLGGRNTDLTGSIRVGANLADRHQGRASARYPVPCGGCFAARFAKRTLQEQRDC